MGLHFGDDDCGKDPTIPHFEFFLVARERAQIRPVNILRTVEHRIGETAVGVQAIKELCALHQGPVVPRPCRFSSRRAGTGATS